jgi:hypothetical protein
MLSLVAAVPLSLRVRPTWRAPIAAWRDLYLRYWLAGVLFAYGVQKVLLMQMGVLTPRQLLQPLGMFSPAGLVWAFMAASPSYQRLAGWLELLPAALLLLPHTAMLGAAVAVPVLGNVVALNLLYDVPVKLYSMHLLATSVLLCLPAASGVLAALAGRAVPARPEVIPAATRGWLHLALSFMLFMFTLLAWPWGARSRNARAAQPRVTLSGDLVGVWDVVQRDPAAPPWQALSVSPTREAVARIAGDALRAGLLEGDSVRGTLTVPAPLISGASTMNLATVYQYAYRADTLRLRGVFGTDSIGITLTRRAPMNLLSHPFRWIQAVPDIR